MVSTAVVACRQFGGYTFSFHFIINLKHLLPISHPMSIRCDRLGLGVGVHPRGCQWCVLAFQFTRHLLGTLGSMGELSWHSLERNVHLWLHIRTRGQVLDLGVSDSLLDVDVWAC
jgi:hypothetical protein